MEVASNPHVDNQMLDNESGTANKSHDAVQAKQRRRTWKSGVVGAVAGAVIGAFFGLIAPITAGVAGFALIYLPPPSWIWPRMGVWLYGVLGGLEWMIAGCMLGAFIGAVTRVPPREPPSNVDMQTPR
jgi:hypothetical protein